MSVLSSTYLNFIQDRNRYGENDIGSPIEIHIASAMFEHVHLEMEQIQEGDNLRSIEVNMTIEEAKEVIEALELALNSAKKGRSLRE